MRILIVGDQHFKLDLPYSSYFEDRRVEEWEAVKNRIHKVAMDCDTVVLLGDNLNSKNNHSAVIAEFVQFLKGFGDKEIHILVGNHERSGNVTALDFLKKINKSKWHVHTEPTIVGDGKDLTFAMVPYVTPNMVDAKDNAEGVENLLSKLYSADVAFFHQSITGAKVHGQMVDLFNEIVLPIEKLEEKYKRIFSGHIHVTQELSPKTTITGNIFTNETGDDKKYVFVYDTEIKTTEKIELPCRGIYKVTQPGTDFSGIPDNSIVKCILTDKNIGVEETKGYLQKFDAHVIIEKYPSERTKLHFEEGSLDLSIDNIFKVYSDSKSIDIESLQRGFDLIK